MVNVSTTVGHVDSNYLFSGGSDGLRAHISLRILRLGKRSCSGQLDVNDFRNGRHSSIFPFAASFMGGSLVSIDKQTRMADAECARVRVRVHVLSLSNRAPTQKSSATLCALPAMCINFPR